MSIFLGQLDLSIRRIYRKIFRIKPTCLTFIDKLGIPIIYYSKYGCQRNPASVCQFAIKCYESADGKGNKRLFMNCVNWLMNNLSNKGTYSVWEHIFGQNNSWVSSLSQGLGVNVFALANKLTKDEKFIDGALRALNAFTVPLESGGVLYIDKNDEGWWYEEYPWLESHVLNGHIEAVRGVYEFYKHVNDNRALEIFEEGIKELKKHLHEYDNGFWTYYDRKGNIASVEYHKLHVEEMFWLWKITGESIFLRYYNKWKAYIKKPSSILYRYGILRRILQLISRSNYLH